MLPADISLHSDQNLVFAADLGGTHLRAAAVDRASRIHFRLKQKTPKTDTPDEIVSALINAVAECRKTVAADGKAISALCVAVPGTVKFRDGIVVTVPNLPALANVPLGPLLRNAVGCPAIIENDANVAALGEAWRGAGRGYQDIVCVTLGTGVGGGIISRGELWRGVDGSAGEVGHTAVEPFAGVDCECGSQGCLEVYASATAIVRMAREGLKDFPDSNVGGERELTAEGVFHAARNGDQLGRQVFNRMGEYLGVGLANVVNLLNPEVIIIGGGVANAWELFHEPMQRTVFDKAFPIPARRAKITKAECGDDAGLLGAAHLAFTSDTKLEA